MQKFTEKYRIYYEDTDSGGVVYYANYLKFFERARTDFLRHLGISQANLVAEKNIVFVVKKCQIDYKKPAKLDDLVDVSVEIVQKKAASVKMYQEMTLNGAILAVLEVEIVCVDAKNFRPQKIPDLLFG